MIRVSTIIVLSLTLSMVKAQVPLASCINTGSNGYILSNGAVTAAQAPTSCPAGYKMADLSFQAPDTAPYAALNFLQNCFGSSITSLQVFAHSYNGANVGTGPMVMYVNTNIPSITAFVPVSGAPVLYVLCDAIGGGGVVNTGTACPQPTVQTFENFLNDGNNDPTYTSWTRVDTFQLANIYIWGACQSTTAAVITPAGPKYIAVDSTTSTGLPVLPFVTITKPLARASFQIDSLTVCSPFQTQTLTFKTYHVGGAIDTITFPNIGILFSLINVATDVRFENLIKVEIYPSKGLTFGADDVKWC